VELEDWEKATVVVTLRVVPEPEQIPNIRFVQFLSAGLNHVPDTPLFAKSAIPLTSSSGIHGPQIAEWVIMTALSFAHQLPHMIQWQRDHEWNRFDFDTIQDYASQRLGVLGYGSIGRQGKLYL
jgi:phosphoglycerate dehydrogenase-like enzyme